MKESKGLTIVGWVIAVVVVLGLLAWAVWGLFIASPNYNAVLLTSGELYFGQLKTFPTYGLKQVYTIQANPEGAEQPFSIQKFSNIFWGPEDFLQINRDNVIWTAELSDQSQLSQLLENNPDLISQQQQQPTGGQPVPGSGTMGDEVQQVPGQ